MTILTVAQVRTIVGEAPTTATVAVEKLDASGRIIYSLGKPVMDRGILNEDGTF